jgi:uncharacterized paraquat-inducible protein A
MSRLVSRILLAILMFPVAAIFYIYVFVLCVSGVQRNYFNRIEASLLISSLLTWILVAIYWCALWKSTVRWNSIRFSRTVLAAFLAMIIAFIAVIATANFADIPGRTAILLGGLLAIVLWLIATVLIWRETPAERAQRLAASPANSVSCPTCGYNLTGLTESRCPECGSKFTLNELLASQPNQKSEID